jgi:D-3-phosphoglycerate dehydrogenase / 2-oxoglutarate reductase
MTTFKVAMVALDGQEVPDWVRERLGQKGIEFVVRECTTREELAATAGDADVVWVFGAPHVLTAENLPLIPRCGAIIRTGSGTDDVPVDEATRLGILVVNTPEAFTDAVSDHAIGLLFAVVRRIAVQDRAVRGGRWDRAVAWPYWCVRGRTLGLVGFGLIARSVARKMGGFDMTVLTHDPYLSPQTTMSQGAHAVSLEELLVRSDIVSVHCPLTKETYHLIDDRALRSMNPGAILINTSRGRVVDEAALARALQESRLAGAGLDVLESEPPDQTSPLFKLDNVVITPHIAAYSETYPDMSWRLSVEAVISLKEGRWPSSYVNRRVQPRWPLG